jgi:hypothetical protein
MSKGGENMKFLLMWSWCTKDAKEVTERFKKWKPVGDMKFLFPMHTIIGANKGFTIIDSDSTELAYKNTAAWGDLMEFQFYPIIDSREGMTLLQ